MTTSASPLEALEDFDFVVGLNGTSRPTTRFAPTPSPTTQELIAELGYSALPMDWQQDALCAQTDPEVFFPDKGGNAAVAKQVCASCPVSQQCLDYAIANDEPHGIWGGLSDRQRRAEKHRREHQKARKAA